MIEIDFEKFEDEYKLTLTERKVVGSSSVVFEDDENNRLILLKIKSKNDVCTGCVAVKSEDIDPKSIEIIERDYGLKLIKDRG